MEMSPRPIEQAARLLCLIGVFLILPAAVAVGGDEPSEKPVVSSSEPSFTLFSVDGSTLSGHLRQLDTKAGVEIIDAKRSTPTLPLLGIVKITRDAPPSPPPFEDGLVVFPDGDRLQHARIRRVDDEGLEIQSATFGTLTIPVDHLLGVILNSQGDPALSASLIAKIRETPRKSEVVWLGNGDRADGGSIVIDEKLVKLKTAGGLSQFERAGVLAIGYDPALTSYPKPELPFLEVLLLDGSRLGLREAHFETGYLSGSARFGANLKIPMGEISRIDVRSDRIQYLSEQPALQDRYREFVGPTRPYRRDLNVMGGPIRLKGQAFERGLGTQPRTLLAYRVEPGWKFFQATVGLDDQAGPLSHVVFRVIVDGKERAVSPAIAASGSSFSFNVELSGAKTLVLITEFGERGNIHDLADWADARMTR